MPRVIHARHVHSHIAMAEGWGRVHRGDFGAQVDISRQSAARITGSVDTLGKEGVGGVGFRFDYDIVSFSHAYAEFIDAYRLDILAIGGDYSHFQTGNAHIKNGHGGAVDKAQAHFFAGFT